MNQINDRKDYRRVPNLNFIPPEYQARTVPCRQLLLRLFLVVMIASGAFLAANVYQQRSAVQASTESVQRKIQKADKDLAAVNARKEEAKKLQAAIDALKKQNEVTKEDWAFVREQAEWPLVIEALLRSKPEGVQLRSVVKQETSLVTVAGTATDYVALLRYRDQVQSSPVILKVVSLNSSTSKAESSLTFSMVAEVKKRVATSKPTP